MCKIVNPSSFVSYYILKLTKKNMCKFCFECCWISLTKHNMPMASQKCNTHLLGHYIFEKHVVFFLWYLTSIWHVPSRYHEGFLPKEITMILTSCETCASCFTLHLMVWKVILCIPIKALDKGIPQMRGLGQGGRQVWPNNKANSKCFKNFL
jgi:hypothetical protein